VCDSIPQLRGLAARYQRSEISPAASKRPSDVLLIFRSSGDVL